MTSIYLIRHAEAEGNLYRIAQGQKNSNLTDRGWRQVRALEFQRPVPYLRHCQRHLQAQGAAPAPGPGSAGDQRGHLGAAHLGRHLPL